MKHFLKELGRRAILPPAIIKYGDEMSPAARKRVTRDLIWLSLITSAYAVYNIYLQSKLADAELRATFRSSDPLGDSDHADAYHYRAPLDTSDCDEEPCARKASTGEVLYCAKHYETLLDEAVYRTWGTD